MFFVLGKEDIHESILNLLQGGMHVTGGGDRRHNCVRIV